MLHRPGIYAIVHVLSGRRYIGQSKNIEKRWGQHRELLKGESHHNQRLQKVWSSDGELAFEFLVVEYAPANLESLALQRWLYKKEKYHINLHKSRNAAFNIVDAELVAAGSAGAQKINAKSIPGDHPDLIKLQELFELIQCHKREEREINSQISTLKGLRGIVRDKRVSKINEITLKNKLIQLVFKKTKRVTEIEKEIKVLDGRASELEEKISDLISILNEVGNIIRELNKEFDSYPKNIKKAFYDLGAEVEN